MASQPRRVVNHDDGRSRHRGESAAYESCAAFAHTSAWPDPLRYCITKKTLKVNVAIVPYSGSTKAAKGAANPVSHRPIHQPNP
jgi:hypothetical protein